MALFLAQFLIPEVCLFVCLFAFSELKMVPVAGLCERPREIQTELNMSGCLM